MNLRGPRDLVRAAFASAVDSSGYDATAQVDWSAFSDKPLEPSAVDVTTLGGVIDALWFRPQMYSIPGSASPMGLGPSSATTREARLLIAGFAPWTAGEDEILSALSSINDYLHRDELTDGLGCHVHLYDAEEPDVLGRRGEYVQVNFLIPLLVQDHSDGDAGLLAMSEGGFLTLEDGSGLLELEA